MQKAGIKMLDVPFAGASEAMTAMLGNNIDISLGSFSSLYIGQLDAKKIRVLGFDSKIESYPDDSYF